MTMTYTKRSNVPAIEGETVVELDTGALVAVRCDRKRVDAGVCYHAQARAVDAVGAALLFPGGRPIQTEFKHSVPVSRVDEIGDAVITRECLFAVLGEPVSVFPWPESVLTGVSIRVSLAAAQVSGTADAASVL